MFSRRWFFVISDFPILHHCISICLIDQCMSANIRIYALCKSPYMGLTHLLVRYICISESDQHWVRWRLVGYSAPSYNPNQCLRGVNLTFRNNIRWNFNQNTKFVINENASENIVCEMAAFLSRGDELWMSPPRATSQRCATYIHFIDYIFDELPL